MKREFLQLCQTYKPGKHNINGWFISTKLDGMRAFWDGGISRGMKTREVPWANTEKDYKLVVESVATGLWSRMGKVIHAPDEFLDRLPRMPLDGELYLGPGRFQDVMKIVKAHSGRDWGKVKYKVFDSPPLETVFRDGMIEVRVGNDVYRREFRNIMTWIKGRTKGLECVKEGMSFERVYEMLLDRDIDLVVQNRLPFHTGKIKEVVDDYLNNALLMGDEGVIIRAHNIGWKAERGHHCLKYKPYLDSEGIVVGYKWGLGKLLGMMGAMIVQWRGKCFELSGFTDNERRMSKEDKENGGGLVEEDIENIMFPRGSVVTFKYRELSDEGIPKEGRYWRKLI